MTDRSKLALVPLWLLCVLAPIACQEEGSDLKAEAITDGVNAQDTPQNDSTTHDEPSADDTPHDNTPERDTHDGTPADDTPPGRGDAPEVKAAILLGGAGGVLIEVQVKKVGNGIPEEIWVWSGTNDAATAPEGAADAQEAGLLAGHGTPQPAMDVAYRYFSAATNLKPNGDNLWVLVRVRYREDSTDFFKDYRVAYTQRSSEYSPEDHGRTKPFHVRPTIALGDT